MKKTYLAIVCAVLQLPLIAQNIGIGTVAPTDKLHINAAINDDPLRVQVNNATKLRVWANGGTSIGSFIAAPANGLYVSGPVQLQDGSVTAPKIVIESTNDSIILNAGGSQIILAANGNIIIKAPASKITIDAATDLELKGANISILSQGNLTIQAGGNMFLNSPLTRFNNGSRRMAAIGDQVAVSMGAGAITTGTPTVLTQ